MRVPIFATLALLLFLGSAPTGAAADTSRIRRGWDYLIEPDLALETVKVTITFRRFLPRRLVFAEPTARGAMRALPAPGGGTATLRNELGGDGVIPSGLGPGGSVSYEMDVRSLQRRFGGWRASRVGGDVVLRPGLFLARPAVWPESVYVTARFRCPAKQSALAPWPRVSAGDPSHYELTTPYTLQLEGLVAMGRFSIEDVPAAGADLYVARLDKPTKTTGRDVATWIRAAAEAVAPLFGRFPTPFAQILVEPSRPSYQPVAFGRSMRPGGASALFYVSSTADAESLLGEWIGVHELLHLGMPWTYPEESWFQEGFVTYYQEVMRARAGFLTPEEGWGGLIAGFGRGARGSGNGTALSQASTSMHQSHAYWRVYWGGATIALLIDLEIRRVFEGTRCLDDVMRHLYRRYGKDRKNVHRGLDLLAEADRHLGRAICVPIARRVLAETRQRDLDPVLASLGVRVDGRQVALDPEAPRARDALAIMGGRKRR